MQIPLIVFVLVLPNQEHISGGLVTISGQSRLSMTEETPKTFENLGYLVFPKREPQRQVSTKTIKIQFKGYV